MESNSARQAVTNPEPTSPELKPPAAAVTLPQESTGDSDESDADVSVPTAGCSSETDDDDGDDAESCSGGGFRGGYYFIGSASKEDDEISGEFEDDGVTMAEVDMTEVDSKMVAVPWWRRTGECAAKGDDDGGCAPAAVAAQGAGKFGGGGHAAAESNRLFWEACIAHGY